MVSRDLAFEKYPAAKADWYYSGKKWIGLLELRM
jgi:hypothetical protein